MSVIRVSGSKRGKVHRVYGSSNYISSDYSYKRTNKNKSTEKDYYKEMISITKSHAHFKNSSNYLHNIQKVGKRLSKNTLLKVLKAYQDTLLRNRPLTKQLRREYISSYLPKNLKKYNVPPSTAQKILKYDPHYKEIPGMTNKLSVRPSNKGVTTNKKETKKYTNKLNPLFSNNPSYFNKIIHFAYGGADETKRKEFVSELNKGQKLLSDTVVQNILEAYMLTLDGSQTKKQKRKQINEKLELYLLQNGVHPDIIQILLHQDPRYNSEQ